MTEARSILVARSKEIRAMQRHILAVEKSSTAAQPPNLRRGDVVLIQNSLKAAFLLMLYNLAEAIIISSIHEIFERVSREQLSYAAVSLSIRNFWIIRQASRVRRGSVDTHAELIKTAIDTALDGNGLQSFPREEIRQSYLGNIDARVIKRLASEFSVELTLRKSGRDGEGLRMIKINRNDLGHGIYSFHEVGANYSAADLRETSIRVRRFLLDAVAAFQHFIDERGYVFREPSASGEEALSATA